MSPSNPSTAKPPKPNLSDYEEETVPLDDVLRRILAAKPAPVKEPKPSKPKPD